MQNINIVNLDKGNLDEVLGICDLYWNDEFSTHLKKRLNDYIDANEESTKQNFKFFVAVANEEVVGVAGMRNVPEKMKGFCTTDNAVELYIMAVKYKNKGVGTTLLEKRIQIAKESGYREAILFGGITHQESWGFYDTKFKRVGDTLGTGNEEGTIWRVEL